MPAVLVSVLGFIVSGLVWRILASIGFSMLTAAFINYIVNDYVNRALNEMSNGLPVEVSALLGIARADECISIMIGGIVFIATYKSLKFIFVRS